MRMKQLTIVPLVLLSACEPNQLYMGSHTVVGINGAINPEQSTGRLIIGYDRDFAAVVPRSAPPAPNSPANHRDAMSAIACSDMTVDGIALRRYTESIATGQAASSFATRLAQPQTPQQYALKDFFDCFREQRTGQNQQGSE